MDLVCWSYRMILSFQFCNNLAFAVPEPWPSQGLHFRGSFHSHPELQPSMLGISSPVLPHQHFLKSSGSPLHIPSPASKHLPQQLSSGFIYRFYWHCCNSKCCPADTELEKSRASVSEPGLCWICATALTKPSLPKKFIPPSLANTLIFTLSLSFSVIIVR